MVASTPKRSLEDREKLRRFYQRWILGFGIAWGIQLLITLPFVVGGERDFGLRIDAVILNGITLSPASVLAFWHRRLASVWLTGNAGLLIVAILHDPFRARALSPAALIGILVPVALASAVTIMELQHWPSALTYKE